MVTSVSLHVLVLSLLLLVPASSLLRSVPPKKKEVDIVFYRPQEVPVPARAVPLSLDRGKTGGAGAPAPAAKPRVNAPEGPDGPGKPELPSGPHEGFSAEAQPPQP